MNEPDEISEGGNPIYRYKPREKPFEPVSGKPEHIQRIEEHITRHIGEPSVVFHELISDLVHLDVHIVPPRPDRDFYTLITSGMSERAMKVPEGAEEFSYAELLICLPADWKLRQEDFNDENNYWPIRLLKGLARMPHEYDTWLSFAHTIPNGDPAEPYAPNAEFCCAMLAPPTLAPEEFWNFQATPETVIHFLAVLPLYAEETELKLKKGADELFERFDKNQINELVDLKRKNVARKLFGISNRIAMPLPDLIEIVPLDKPVRAEITVPGSKSITNRALILAAQADGEVTLEGALWSEDTQVMTEALQKLGFEIKVAPDAQEFCNRRITVTGQGGRIPNAGTAEKPLELFVGNAGTAARFLAAMVCLGNGVYRLSGVPRMHERPQAALFKALRELGYRVESERDRLPVNIHGVGWKPGTCHVSVSESSQFASALLLGAEIGGWDVRIQADDIEEMPYVEMTRRLIEAFPKSGGEFVIEPDASSGSYFWAASWLVYALWRPGSNPQGLRWEDPPISVTRWPTSGWQIDAEFPDFLPVPGSISREGQLGDAIMTAIILAADADTVMVGVEGVVAKKFTDLGRLRVQECERVVALRTELTKCGARVIEAGDTLTVYPSKLNGAEIETYNDHRMAMCFAILGLKVPGIKIKNPACVKKTFPNFFQKLATPPPNGLGANILEAKSGRKLEMDELFAD